MYRAVCEYLKLENGSKQLTRCTNRFRSRVKHKLCRACFLTAHGKARLIGRVKKVKLLKSKPATIETKKGKRK